MTPHDEWDYDGVNEMILADIRRRRARPHRPSSTSTATASATRSIAQPASCWSREKFDPAVNWATEIDMETGRPEVVRQYWTRSTAARTSTARTSARRRWARRTSSRLLLAEDQAVLRADQPRLHGLRAVQGVLHGRSALCRRDASTCIRRRATAISATSSPGMPARARSSGPTRSPSRYGGRAATAGDVVFYGTLEGYLKAVDHEDRQGAVPVQDAVRHHRQRQHLDARRQAVRRRPSGVGGWAGIGLAAGL